MKLTAKFEPPAQKPAPRQPTPTPRPALRSEIPPPSSAAKNLATAYHIQRLIDRGLIADYTAAAKMLGVSQPRLTHLMGLLLLAPEIQAAILLGEMTFGDKELRCLARIGNWSDQMACVRQRGIASLANGR